MAFKLPKHIEKKILAEAKKNNGHISASEYKKITSLEKQKRKGYVYTLEDFSFNFHIEKISEKKVKFILIGKHLSTNVINSLPFRKKLKYKSAIKKAAEDFFMVYGKKIKFEKPCKKGVIYPIAYNLKSRDDDANVITLKILRDLLTSFGYIEDDSREFLKETPCKEILQKEYKIELLLVCGEED